jgi:peptide/nickel transport system substrate-binding protein
MIDRRALRAVTVALLLALFAAACAPATSAPTAAPTKPADKPAAATAPAGKPGEAPAAKPGAQGDRLVVAVGQWGIETPFAWRASQSEKTLWDVMYDPLIMRDPKTFEYRPGLATEWTNSPDYKSWTFKLRQGVMFHRDFGELTSEDVKFTIEQHLKPDAQGASAPFFRAQLDRIETPDKYSFVLHFKNPAWEVPSHFTQFVGYQNITSKKHVESVGEERAAQDPVGTGPYRHVEGKQGDSHRFEAVPNHWRVTPAFKELVIRRIPDPATRLAGIRSGEIDIGQVFGDYLDQATKAGLRIHEAPNATGYWVILSGQTTPDRDDYCPMCPWAGDPNDPVSQQNALKVRQALNLAVDKPALIDGLWKGTGSQTPYMYWYYPLNKGYDQNWKLPPYDAQRAKQLLAEAGYPNGFEIRVNPMVFTFASDAPDVMEAVALDWEKIGIKVRRAQEDFGNFLPKVRARKTAQTAWVYAGPPFDEPSLGWQRTIWTQGAFNLLAEGPFDQDIDAILRELDVEKRTRMTHDLGQKLYDGYHGVPLGMKTLTWAVTKKVADWPTLTVPLETNYEYVTYSGQ